jgi:hypothetical protein
MLGPTLGFLYGSYALQMYVAPSAHPAITSDDPRWMGAWWHGETQFGHVTHICVLSTARSAIFYMKILVVRYAMLTR